MSAAEQFHVDEVSPSYWRVTFDNGPVNLLDPDTVDQLGALIGRIDAAATSFGSASDLASAMVRAALAHGQHEKRIGAADPDWPDWYAAYMVAEQAGKELPT